MIIKTTKMIEDMATLRNACIEMDWFTKGTCEEYDTFLKKWNYKENITDNDIYEIAVEIFNHSDLELYKNNGFTKIETIENIMYKINNSCTFTTFKVVE